MPPCEKVGEGEVDMREKYVSIHRYQVIVHTSNILHMYLTNYNNENKIFTLNYLLDMARNCM